MSGPDYLIPIFLDLFFLQLRHRLLKLDPITERLHPHLFKVITAELEENPSGHLVRSKVPVSGPAQIELTD